MGKLSCAVLPQSLPALLLSLSCIFGLSLGTELSFVTCGSVIKLLNIKHNVRLHSHDVRYGSGEFPLIKRLLSINKHLNRVYHSHLLYLPLPTSVTNTGLLKGENWKQLISMYKG